MTAIYREPITPRLLRFALYLLANTAEPAIDDSCAL